MDARSWLERTWARWILRKPAAAPGIATEPAPGIDAGPSLAAQARTDKREGLDVVRVDLVDRLAACLLPGAEWRSVQMELEGSRHVACRLLEAVDPARYRPSKPPVPVVDRLRVTLDADERTGPAVLWSATLVIPLVIDKQRSGSASGQVSGASPKTSDSPAA